MKNGIFVVWSYGMVFLSLLLLIVVACILMGGQVTNLALGLSWVGLGISTITIIEALVNEQGLKILVFRIGIFLAFCAILVPFGSLCAHLLFCASALALLISVMNACYWLATHNRQQLEDNQ